MPVSYKHPRPAVTVDCAVFRNGPSGELELLLIQRKAAPYKGRWALPGGFVEMDESLEVAARRELREETSLGGVRLRQFHAFGDPGRDPRGRTISVAFVGLLGRAINSARAGDDAAAVAWFSVQRLPALAFDHRKIVKRARQEIQRQNGR